MNALSDEYRQILSKTGLSKDPSEFSKNLRDPSTWLELARRIRHSNPDDALWCFKTAMECDVNCYPAFVGAAEIMAERGEHLKAVGYYSLAYSPSLLNYSVLDLMAAHFRQSGLAEFYEQNLLRFARRIEGRRDVDLPYDLNLHNEVARALSDSGVGCFSKEAPGGVKFASTTAYDIYRLPDGRRNPTKYPNSSFHASMQPSAETMISAVRRTLLPLLDENEAWLLSLPMLAIDMYHIFPLVYLHPTQGPVVVLPMGTFGSLFAVNEILVLSQMSESGERDLTLSAGTLRAFLTGRGEVDQFRSMMPLLIRPEHDPLLNYQVWKRTVIHQMFMLLHELGHVALGHIKDNRQSVSFTGWFKARVPSSPLSLVWFPGDSNEELAADDWAASHLFGGIPGVEFAKGGYGWIDLEIKELFALLGFLELSGDKANHLTSSALKRWQTVASSLSILHALPGAMDSRDIDDFRDLGKYLSRRVDHPSSANRTREAGSYPVQPQVTDEPVSLSGPRVPSALEKLEAKLGIPIHGQFPDDPDAAYRIGGSDTLYCSELTLDMRGRSPSDLLQDPGIWTTIRDAITNMKNSLQSKQLMEANAIYVEEANVQAFIMIEAPDVFECWVAVAEEWTLLRRVAAEIGRRKPGNTRFVLEQFGKSTLISRPPVLNSGELPWQYLLIEPKKEAATSIHPFVLESVEAITGKLNLAAVVMGMAFESAEEFEAGARYLEREYQSGRVNEMNGITKAMFLEQSGICHYASGTKDLALTRFLEILHTGQRLGPANYNIGTLLSEMGTASRNRRAFEMAEKYLRASISEDPEYYSAWFNLCCVLCLQDKKEEIHRLLAATTALNRTRIYDELYGSAEWRNPPPHLSDEPFTLPVTRTSD